MAAHGPDAALGRRGFLVGGAAAAAAALTACASSQAVSESHSRTAAAAAARSEVRFGLNYTPSRHWWFIWQNWDAGAVDEDLAQIASLGMDHIRIQLLWSMFQPSPTHVVPELLDRLEELLDLADRHRLDVNVSVLTSYISGQQFIPTWARAGNWVKRPDLVAGQVYFFAELARRIGSHPRFLGFDTGNENIGRAPSRDDVELATWSTTLIDAARDNGSARGFHSVSPSGLFVPPHPGVLATVGDVSVVHPWYFLSDGVVNGRLREEPLHHVEYNIEYLKSFHTYAPQSPRRKVWVQEIGAPSVNFLGTQSIPTALAPDFTVATLENALTCEDLYGITWWCSHDIRMDQVPAIFHSPEPTLGVFDTRGRPKPVAHALADVIARWKRGALPAPTPRTVAVTGENSLAFNTLYEQGVRAAVVQPALATNHSYLARRGLTSVT